MNSEINELIDQSNFFPIILQNLQKEITNEDLLLHLDKTKYPVNDIQKCFKNSELVEFAKSLPDEKIFYDLVSVVGLYLTKSSNF